MTAIPCRELLLKRKASYAATLGKAEVNHSCISV